MTSGRSAVLLVSVLLAACGDSSPAPASSSPGKPAAAASAPTGAAALPGLPAMREITRDEFDRYLGAVKDVRAMGEEVSGRPPAKGGDMANMFQGMQDVAQFNGIVGKHGFDQASFLDVHTNVVWSYGALQLDAQQAEMDKAKAEQDAAFEKMKGMMSEQQIAAMKAQLDTANAQIESMRDVPPANKALLAERLADFEAAIGKKG